MAESTPPEGEAPSLAPPAGASPPDHPRGVRVSFRGSAADPHAVRAEVFGAAFEALTGRPAASSHPTVEVPDGADLTDPRVLAGLAAAAEPRHLVRITYPVLPCACGRLEGLHLRAAGCPLPDPAAVEVSVDNGATWQPVGLPVT